MRPIYCFLTFAFLISFTFAQIPVFCLQGSTKHASYQELQNDTEWGGYLLGFCEGLYNLNDTIIPTKDISCSGEGGNLTLVRRSVGTLSSRCRRAIAKFMCFLYLPIYRDDGLVAFPLGLPCTDQQANISIAQPYTLLEWAEDECGETQFSQLVEGGFDSAFIGVDERMETLPFLREQCRVVDEGDNERLSDRHRNWRPDFSCPNPLKKVSEINDEDHSVIGCAFPCPAPLYTQDQWDSMTFLFRNINWITFLMGIVSVYRQFHQPEQRKFPRNLILMLSCAVVVVQFTAFFGVFQELSGGKQSDIWCKNEYTIQSDFWSVCTLQGFMFHYFGKISFTLWFAVIVNLYLSIVKDNQSTELYKNYYYIFGLGYPLIYNVLALGFDKYEYPTASSWCFLSLERKGLYQYVLFYWDIFLFLILGIYFTARIVYFIVHVKMSYEAGQAKTVLFSVKIMVFLGYIFFVDFVAAYLRIEASINEDDITDSTANWVRCRVVQYIATPETYSNGTLSVAETDYSSCVLTSKPNFGILFTFCILLCTAGFIILIMFGIFPSDARVIAQKLGFGKLDDESKSGTKDSTIKSTAKVVFVSTSQTTRTGTSAQP